MKAAQITKYGDEEAVVTNADVTKPVAGIGQVVVEVHAAGVNPFDYKVREGMMASMKQLDFPATLGGDFAGVITEVGERVSGFEVGEAVYGMAGALSGQGSFAEFAPIAVESIGPKPKSLDFVMAAALPLAAVSAYQALVDHASLQAGQKILVHGGSGGIGSLVIQIAKHMGAYVAATASSDSADFVKSLGADEVIDYNSQDFSTLVHDYDAVFDPIGGETNKKSYTILKPGGALVSMVEQVDEALAAQYKVHYTTEFTRVTTERLAEIAALVDDGTLKVAVDKVFNLDEAAAALEYVKTGHPNGKVVIKIET